MEEATTRMNQRIESTDSRQLDAHVRPLQKRRSKENSKAKETLVPVYIYISFTCFIETWTNTEWQKCLQGRNDAGKDKKRKKERPKYLQEWPLVANMLSRFLSRSWMSHSSSVAATAAPPIPPPPPAPPIVASLASAMPSLPRPRLPRPNFRQTRTVKCQS